MDRRLFFSTLPAAAGLTAAPKARPVKLFDGRTLHGWQNPHRELKAWVEKGELCLLSKKPVWLVHESVYGDFVLDADVFVPDGGNSGVQFRSHLDGMRVYGYQAEIDTSSRRWSGGLYDQGRRTWLAPLEGKPEAQRVYRNNQWNSVRVQCVADRIQIWMNGVLTTDYIDPVDIQGRIALQHHGDFQGHPAETYRFRNLRLLPLGMRRWLRSEEAGLRWSDPGDNVWRERDSRFIWRPVCQSRIEAKIGSPREELTMRFWCKPVEGSVRLILSDSSGPVSVTLAPDERFGQLDRPDSSPTLATKPVRPFFARALWNLIAVSSRAGRLVVHVNGIRTADWKRPRPFAAGGFAFEAAASSHAEFRDFELLS